MKEIMFRNNIRNVLSLLTKSDKFKLVYLTFTQIILSLLDLLGILALGLLGIIAVGENNLEFQNSFLGKFINFEYIFNLNYNNQITIIGLFIVLTLLFKSFVSMTLNRKIVYFLSKKSSSISTNLLSKFMSLNLNQIYTKTYPEIVASIKSGVATLMIGLLATTCILISEILGLFVIVMGISFYNYQIALTLMLLFSIVSIILYFLTHVKAMSLGEKSTDFNLSFDSKLIELFSTYREIFVRNRRNFYFKHFKNLNDKIANVSAELNYMPYISKYVIEMSLVLGVFAIIFVQTFTSEISESISVITVFLAAGARVAPAILRIQQSLIVIRTSYGSIKPTFEFLSQVNDISTNIEIEDTNLPSSNIFKPKINITNLSYKYPGSNKIALSNISLTIEPGIFLAIIGPSGAGKTTLIDTILGLLKPDSGGVEVSGVSPQNAIKFWPGKIGYVPQEIVLSSDSVRSNITLGFDQSDFDDFEIFESLKSAHLSHVVNNMQDGLHSKLGEKGFKISGGERQRLGIARAMITKPEILILDESTSALDGENEKLIIESLKKMSGRVTIVMIAHKLSTIKQADQIVYMDSGRIKFFGKFDEIKELIGQVILE